MEFAPLRYAISTVTIWHGVVLLGFLGLNIRASVGDGSGESIFHSTLPGLMMACFMFVWMYFLAAPTVGQLFGDKYPFAVVWPSALVLGCLMAAGFVAFALASNGKPLSL